MDKIFVIKQSAQQVLLNGWPLTDLLAVLTFCLLILTIFISIRSINEMSRSNILSSSPVLRIGYIATPEEGRTGLYVENVGHGAALNVKLESYYTTYLNEFTHIKNDKLISNKLIHKRLKFVPIDLVLEGCKMHFDSFGDSGMDFFTHNIIANDMMNQKKLIFHLRYLDITGKRFISRIVISQRRVGFASNPKKYGIFRKTLYGLYLSKEVILMMMVIRPIMYFKQVKLNRKKKEEHKKQAKF